MYAKRCPNCGTQLLLTHDWGCWLVCHNCGYKECIEDENLTEIYNKASQIKFIAKRLLSTHQEWFVQSIRTLANNIQFLVENSQLAEKEEKDENSDC